MSSAKLTDATGNPVEFFLSDPEHPATSFGQFGVICLIPKQLLQAQHAYTRPDRCVLERQTRHLDMELFNGRAAQGSKRPMMLNRSGATSVIRTVCWMFLCSTRFCSDRRA